MNFLCCSKSRSKSPNFLLERNGEVKKSKLAISSAAPPSPRQMPLRAESRTHIASNMTTTFSKDAPIGHQMLGAEPAKTTELNTIGNTAFTVIHNLEQAKQEDVWSRVGTFELVGDNYYNYSNWRWFEKKFPDLPSEQLASDIFEILVSTNKICGEHKNLETYCKTLFGASGDAKQALHFISSQIRGLRVQVLELKNKAVSYHSSEILFRNPEQNLFSPADCQKLLKNLKPEYDKLNETVKSLQPPLVLLQETMDQCHRNFGFYKDEEVEENGVSNKK